MNIPVCPSLKSHHTHNHLCQSIEEPYKREKYFLKYNEGEGNPRSDSEGTLDSDEFWYLLTKDDMHECYTKKSKTKSKSMDNGSWQSDF